MNPKAWVEAVFELIWRIGLRLALWVGGAYVAYRVRSIIVTVILSAVLSYALAPLVDLLCSFRIAHMGRRIQRLIASFLVFAMLGVVLFAVTREFVNPFSVQFKAFTKNSDKYIRKIDELQASVNDWYKTLPEDAQKFIGQQNLDNVLDRGSQWASDVIVTTVSFFSHLLEVILIPVLAFYFLLDSRALKREFVALAPRRRTRETLALLHELNAIMRSYVVGQIILCVIAGVVVGLMLWALHMPYQLVLAVMAGVTRAVPVVGPVISGAAIVLLGLARSPMMGMNLLIAFVLLHVVESKFIMPKLIGERMQLHPALVILFLLIGAEFFGIFGMFMAAPVAAIIRVIIRYYIIKPRQLHVWGLPTAPRPSDSSEDKGSKPLVRSAD